MQNLLGDIFSKKKTIWIISIFFIIIFLSGSGISFHQHPMIKGVKNEKELIKVQQNLLFDPESGRNHINIKFAGNPNDHGRPYWSDVDETDSNVNEGYFVNQSYQQEAEMRIWADISDNDGIEIAMVHFYDMTHEIWYNDTEMIHEGGNNYSAVINANNIDDLSSIQQSHQYSFDIWYKDSLQNTYLQPWSKSGIGGSTVRRSVYLNCTQTNSSYASMQAFYLYPFTSYTSSDTDKKDRLIRDQGPDSSTNDTGFLNSSRPPKDGSISQRQCGGYVGFWYNNESSMQDLCIENILFHFWWNTTNGTLRYAGISDSYDHLKYHDDDSYEEYYAVDENDAAVWLNDTHHWRLENKVLHFDSPHFFTDNSIYEFAIVMDSVWSIFQSNWIRVKSNYSYPSYVIFNIPDNATLNNTYSDSDGDGMHDWDEIYVNSTSPFLEDTDGDGVNDKIEVMDGTSPNIWTDYNYYSPWIHDEHPVDDSADISLQPMVDIMVSDNNSDLTTVTWQSNYSDGVSWETYQVNKNVMTESRLHWMFDGANSSNTTYWWRVFADDARHNVSKTFHFTTEPVPMEVFVNDNYSSSTPNWNYNHFDTIQGGVDAVAEQGTVFVMNGEYHENIVIDKSLSLIGERKNETVVDGGGSDDVITILNHDVVISNFTLHDSGFSDAAIRLTNSSHCRIHHNIISKNNQNGSGIIFDQSSSENVIENNTIKNNDAHGILIYDSSCENIISNNTVETNAIGIKILDKSNNNNLFQNQLINNSQNAYDECESSWDRGYPLGGNYWSDFDESTEGAWDNNSDHFVDTPYLIPGGSNIDAYPIITLDDISYALIAFESNQATVYFNANYSVDHNGDIIAYLWDFGDGNQAFIANPVHTYASDGDYNVSLTVTDDDGNDHTTYRNIRVHTIQTKPGWNLITIPMEADLYASDISSNISGCLGVSSWNSLLQTYQTYIVNGPSSFDFPLQSGVGYFVDVNQVDNCTFTDSLIDAVNISLNTGWNLIGWYNTGDTLASNIANTIAGCQSVSMWNASVQQYQTYIVGGPSSFDFTVSLGMGLFVDVNQNSFWYGE